MFLYPWKKLLVATSDFEDSLSHEEVNLIIQVQSLVKTAALSEIPMYMPKSFPDAAHRLIIVRLFDNVTALGLCGVNPPLSQGKFQKTSTVRDPISILRQK